MENIQLGNCHEIDFSSNNMLSYYYYYYSSKQTFLGNKEIKLKLEIGQSQCTKKKCQFWFYWQAFWVQKEYSSRKEITTVQIWFYQYICLWWKSPQMFTECHSKMTLHNFIFSQKSLYYLKGNGNSKRNTYLAISQCCILLVIHHPNILRCHTLRLTFPQTFSILDMLKLNIVSITLHNYAESS